jgi:hypothetical protein
VIAWTTSRTLLLVFLTYVSEITDLALITHTPVPPTMEDPLPLPPIPRTVQPLSTEQLRYHLIHNDDAPTVQITDTLLRDDLPDEAHGGALLLALGRIRQLVTSPFNSPEPTLTRPVWLKVIRDLTAIIHEGFTNANRLHDPHTEPTCFNDLSPEERTTTGQTLSILQALSDHYWVDNGDEEDRLTRTFCFRCVSSSHISPPSDIITSLALGSALDREAAWTSAMNEAVREVANEAEEWMSSQRSALLTSLVEGLLHGLLPAFRVGHVSTHVSSMY